MKIALLIGVSTYQPGLNPLPSAEKDVQELQRVLQTPEMGGFEQVKSVVNPDPFQMQREIETLFGDRDKDDLVFLFFSGHGITDDSGKLYFATPLTCKTAKGELVRSTAVPASFVHEIMANSRSKRQVVMLDCCFSGAFAEGMTAKDDGRVDVQKQLGGEGRVALTSSTSSQYSFEQQGSNLSVYTRYIVEGIETGAADQDNDGEIAIDELHEYAKRKVQEMAPAMKPEIYAVKEGFTIRLARAVVGDPKLHYRREVERVAERGEISHIARMALDACCQKLGLTAEETQAIETDVLKPYRTYHAHLQQYEQALLEAAKQESPLSDITRKELNFLRNALGLRSEDVHPIEARILDGMSAMSDNSSLSHIPSPTPSEILRRYRDRFLRSVALLLALLIISTGGYWIFSWWRSQKQPSDLQSTPSNLPGSPTTSGLPRVSPIPSTEFSCYVYVPERDGQPQLNVRSNPNPSTNIIGPPVGRVSVENIMSSSGKTLNALDEKGKLTKWIYITHPLKGWVALQPLQFIPCNEPQYQRQPTSPSELSPPI